MRILHLPTATGGNAWALAQGEKQLGLDSRVLVSGNNRFGYPADIDLDLPSGKLGGPWKLFRLLGTFLALRRQFDVFHFNFGSSLIHAPGWGLNQFELPLYPEDVALFVTYNGCDARQKYPTMARRKVAACHDAGCYNGMCNSGQLDELRRRGIAKMSQYAQHIWAVNPDLLHFLPPEKSSFLPYAAPETDEPLPPPVGRSKRLRIVHAPTNRAAKGTAHVLAAIERLTKRFPDAIELVLVEDLSHADAMQVYRSADLVVDQVLIGWYGGLAVEVMQMGKPVVAYIEPDDLRFLPSDMACDVSEAVISAGPDQLEEVLARAIDDRAWLASRAAAAIEYVHRWHAPHHVAQFTRAAYEQHASKRPAA